MALLVGAGRALCVLVGIGERVMPRLAELQTEPRAPVGRCRTREGSPFQQVDRRWTSQVRLGGDLVDVLRCYLAAWRTTSAKDLAVKAVLLIDPGNRLSERRKCWLSEMVAQLRHRCD